MFSQWKEKAADFAVSAAEKAKDIAGFAADKARKAGRIAKLKLEIGAEKENVEKAYAEIGKLYYEAHKDAPEGFFLQLCEEISAALAAVEAKEAELADLKSEIGEAVEDIEDFCAGDADFEAVVSGTEEAAEAPGEDAPPAEE